MLAVRKGTTAMLELLKSAKKADIPAKYVLFDAGFLLQALFMPSRKSDMM